MFLDSLLRSCDFILTGSRFLFRRHLCRKPAPLLGGLVLNDSCNLNCSYCRVHNRSYTCDLTFEQAKRGVDIFRSMGITYCAITGGEPLLWNGGSGMCCADLVSYGRSRGLRMITLYTNGTQPLQGSADVYFVSVDGPEKVHNALRGETFAVILENMKHADAPVFINSTINAKNKDYIEQLCDFVVEQNTIRAIFFYFHTPYYGFDELFIEKNQRKEIIDRIIRLKSKGYPIVNSYTGCTMYANDSWYGPTDLCIVYAYNNIFTCCRAIGNRDACDNCGYIGYIELSAIASLKFEAITNALKYAPLWPHRSA